MFKLLEMENSTNFISLYLIVFFLLLFPIFLEKNMYINAFGITHFIKNHFTKTKKDD